MNATYGNLLEVGEYCLNYGGCKGYMFSFNHPLITRIALTMRDVKKKQTRANGKEVQYCLNYAGCKERLR